MSTRFQTIVRFAACALLSCALAAPLQAAVNILFVTTNNGSLTALESGRKASMESAGYVVNTIWDGASQATFNAAFANNKAIYLSDEATATDVGYKLREATIGIFSEHPGLADELGFCSSATTNTSSATINITNNTHYITLVFPTGAFTLASGACNVTRMAGTTAPGATKLANVGGVDSLVVVDTGATLATSYNSSTVAFGRRAQFPLPISQNTGVTLSANTMTLANRMIAWAAGLDKTLVAWWKLNETSGTTATDSSDFPVNGTVSGTATWTAGMLGNGFQFNGATSITATGMFSNPKNISLAAWAKLTTADSIGADVISLGDHVVIRLDSSGTALASIYNGTTWVSASLTRTFAGSGWHHFALVFDDDNNLLKLYVDGVLAASTSTTNSITWTGLGSNTVVGRNGNAGTNHDFTGVVDDVRIYNYALSNSEVANLYGFVGQWKLADSSGTTATDSTPFAANGTVNGGASWSSDCGGTGVFDFNGTTQYVSVNNAAQLQPTSYISIAAWIKGDAFGTGDAVNAIVRKGDTNPNNYQLAIADSKVVLYLDDSDTVGIRGTTVLTPGQWYHVAAVWDGATVKIYVNGVLDNTPAARTGTIGTDTRPLLVGGRSGADCFDGTIRDVRLYNRPLTSAEVVQLAGFAGVWKFSEGSGTSAADSSGIANNATLSGGATWTTDCAGNNNALLTNGAGGVAKSNTMFNPPDVGTVAFWMRSTGTPAAVARIMGVGADWEIRQNPDGRVITDLCGDGATTLGTVTPLTEVGRWYHVALTFDSSNDTYGIYVDGKLELSGTNPNNMVQQPADFISFGTRTGTTEYWNGALRDVRIYSRKLCPTEIAALAGTAGYWKLDETSGTVAADSSGLGNNGTVSGSPSWTTSGAVNGALQVSSSSDMEVSSLLGSPRNITIAAWGRLTTKDSSGAELISLGDYIAIRLDEGSTSKAFFYNGSSWDFLSVSQTFLGTGWHHFAVVFNDDQNYCKFFIDGVEAASASTTVTIPYTGLGTKLVVGRHGNAKPGWNFTGRIDDVHVYSRALCPAEIATLHDLGTGAFGGIKIIKWVEVQ